MPTLKTRVDVGPMSLRRYTEPAAGWSRRSAHGNLELAWARSGSLIYQLGRAELHVPRGAVVVVPEGVEHRTIMNEGGNAESLHLDSALISRLSDELGPRLALKGLAPGVVYAGEVLERAWAWAACGVPDAATLAADGFVLEILRRRLQAEQLAELRDARIARAVDRVWEDFRETTQVEDLREASGLSRFHFSRQFKARTGKSPYRFLLEVRLGYAAHLIRRRGLKVTEAATTAGFTDLSRFGQLFRRRFGMTPRQYREPR